MKEAAGIVLGRLPPCDVSRGYDSVVKLPAALPDDLFDRPGWGHKNGRQTCPRPAPKELLGLRRSLGGVLKDALGAGVVNELSPGHQPGGHRHLAPGTEPFGQFSGRGRDIGRRCGWFSHGAHSR